MSNNFIFKNYFLYLTCIVICLFSYVRSSPIIPAPLTLKVTIFLKNQLFLPIFVILETDMHMVVV